MHSVKQEFLAIQVSVFLYSAKKTVPNHHLNYNKQQDFINSNLVLKGMSYTLYDLYLPS